MDSVNSEASHIDPSTLSFLQSFEKPAEEKQEIILRGLPAAAGIAFGEAYLHSEEDLSVEELVITSEQVGDELLIWEDALMRAQKELAKILSFVQQRLGFHASNIFEGQLMMINDEVLQSAVKTRIAQEQRNADFIVKDEIERYQKILADSDDEHIRERLADFRDVKHRLIRNIQRKKQRSKIIGQYVIISQHLSPADAVLFSRNDVLGYATDTGGITSHAAILSRSLKIPAVVGLHSASTDIQNGDIVIVDGFRGLVIVHPTDERMQDYIEKMAKVKGVEEKLSELVDLPCETLDGHKVELAANAEFIDELEYVTIQGSRGIGLYRTEHLYIAQGEFPSEEQQFLAYNEIANYMYPQTVIVRTFDIGSDKVLEGQHVEANPSLGWRGTRMMLDKPNIFKTQLRAILRASAQKNIKIMFPMISGVEEIRLAKHYLTEACRELRGDKVRCDQMVEVGVMIELPSAVLIADQLAKEVSFFSIGTNDLIQYILAVDRGNDAIASMYQPFHPAVIRAIKHVIEVGHANGIWVGMCGEMAGDPLATLLLLGLGLDEFSVVPPILPEIKKIVRSVRIEEARAIANKCVMMETAALVKAHLQQEMLERFPELYLSEM